jgi:hypothetical protein
LIEFDGETDAEDIPPMKCPEHRSTSGYEIIDTNAGNIGDCSRCGNKWAGNPGYRRKLAWLKERYAEGLKYELLVKKLKESARDPHFVNTNKRLPKRHRQGLIILSADQCPYVANSVERIADAARTLGLDPKVVRISGAEASRELPTPYGVFGILHEGNLVAGRPISATRFLSLMRRHGVEASHSRWAKCRKVQAA